MANVQLEYSLSRTLIVLTIIAYVLTQSQDTFRVANPRTLARRRTGTSSHTRTSARDDQRTGIIQLRRPLPQFIDQPHGTFRTTNPATLTRQRSQVRTRGSPRTRIIQLRRPLPQRQSIIDLQNLPRETSTIPHARSFQASMVPARLGQRLTTRSHMRGRAQGRTIHGSRTTARRTIALSSLCVAPRSIRCFSWPRNRDSRGAYRCDGGCQRRTCAIPCECSCVNPRIIGRLRAVGRIRGPELISIDTRLRPVSRRELIRNRLLAIRAARQRRQQIQRGAASGNGIRTNELPQRGSGSRGIRTNDLPQRGNPNADLNFGISDDVLATLIAQPVLNEIVGPQGINQIIAGVPPPLLARLSSGNGQFRPDVWPRETPQPDMRVIRTPTTHVQQGKQIMETNMGIPVPINQLNFDPGTQIDPSMGNMRVIMSELRPFQDATTGLNIDLPGPAPMNMLIPSVPVEQSVSVRQLPGTNLLFVDLTRQSPNIPMASPTMQYVPTRMERMSEQSRTIPDMANNTALDDRSHARNNIHELNANQTLLGSVLTDFGGSLQTFLEGTVKAIDRHVRHPTNAECLAQRMELWCDPKKPWVGTPGVSRWCLLNCRTDNCDNQRCACACIDEIIFKEKQNLIR